MRNPFKKADCATCHSMHGGCQGRVFLSSYSLSNASFWDGSPRSRTGMVRTKKSYSQKRGEAPVDLGSGLPIDTFGSDKDPMSRPHVVGGRPEPSTIRQRASIILWSGLPINTFGSDKANHCHARTS